MKKGTRVNHPSRTGLPAGNRALVGPIYQSVKFAFDDVAGTARHLQGEREGYFYSRSSNPTLRELELLLAGLQGRDDCLLTASGVAAVSACLLALCRGGDHVLAFIESYPPTRYLLKRLLGRYGVTHTLLSITDTAGIERVLREVPTRLVIFESPTNPVTRIADIAHLTAQAARAGTLTVMDNTFAGFHNHGRFPVDVFLHSLTKFASGHGDVLGGAMIASQQLIDAMRRDVINLGPTLDPHAAFLVQRGMRSYFLRYERQCATALRLATLLAADPRVAAIHYPGLPSHPQHALAAAQMEDFGAVLSFELSGGQERSDRFADALRYFSIAASLGSTESLVMPSRLLGGGELSAAERGTALLAPGLVRLSIGLEEPEDLAADLVAALDEAFARG
jgi:cystathionine beta-lyase/cystathionine gamma-synthase